MSAKVRKVPVTCIVCPIGCRVELTARGKEILDVKGCKCERGRTYAIEECVLPKRILTTTIPILGGQIPMLPVRTTKPVPKELMMPCMFVLKRLDVEAPVKLGQVVVLNILNTGADIVASRSVPKR